MAGGLGTRLRPLTLTTPKPLLPVGGRPIVEHVLEHAREHGTTEAVLTVHHLAPALRSWLGDGTDHGVAIRYATEDRPLGTAGGVRAALGDALHEEVLVLSGDAISDIDLTAVIARHRESRAALTMALTRRDDPREFGLVDIDDAQRVRRFQEKPGWGEVFGDLVSTGIYVISPQILRGIPDGPVDWSADVIPSLLRDGVPVIGVPCEGYWEDVGDLDAYRQVQSDALEGRVRLRLPGVDRGDGVRVGDGTDISPDARVEPPAIIGARVVVEGGAVVGSGTVVGDNSLVRRGALLERATLLPGVTVGPDAHVLGGIVGADASIGARSRIDEAAVVADDCTLEAEVEVCAGSIVYPAKIVEAGAVVRGTTRWDARVHRETITTRGVTGDMGTDVSPDVVVRVCQAIASRLASSGVVGVSSDGSDAAVAYAGIVSGTLAAAGADVRDLGAVPVPVARQDTAQHAQSGVHVRRSRRDSSGLDLLLFGPDGADISAGEARHLQRLFDRRESRRSVPGHVGDLLRPEYAVADYAEAVRRVALRPLAAAGGPMVVVVDGERGSVADVLARVLDGMPVRLVRHDVGARPAHDDGAGIGGGEVDTGEDRVDPWDSLVERLIHERAALGIAIDPSGERISLVDEQGAVLDDDRALLVIADLAAAEHRQGYVVLPVTASDTAERIAEFHGISARRMARDQVFAPGLPGAGDPGLLAAGDGEGGICLPGMTGSPDAIAAATAIICWIARTGLPLSAVDARIPRRARWRFSVEVPWGRVGAVMAGLRRHAGDALRDTADGLRIAEPGDAWVHVSPDAHAPRILVWVEAASDELGAALVEEWTGRILDLSRGVPDVLAADGSGG